MKRGVQAPAGEVLMGKAVQEEEEEGDVAQGEGPEASFGVCPALSSGLLPLQLPEGGGGVPSGTGPDERGVPSGTGPALSWGPDPAPAAQG